MADMRRSSPEPPPGPLEVRMKPGMADEMLRDLAPLLSEDGVDISDVDTLNRAMQRAVNF